MNPYFFHNCFKNHTIIGTHKIHRPLEFKIYQVPAFRDGGEKVWEGEMTHPRSQRIQAPWFPGPNIFSSLRLPKSAVTVLLCRVHTPSEAQPSSARPAESVSPSDRAGPCVYFYSFTAAWTDIKPLKRKTFGSGSAPNEELRKAFSWNKCTENITTQIVCARKHTVNMAK